MNRLPPSSSPMFLASPGALPTGALLGLLFGLLLAVGAAGCAAVAPGRLDRVAEADRAIVTVTSERDVYGSRAGRVKLSVFDYGDECPPERDRTSSAAYRGSMSVRRPDAEAELSVSSGNATLVRILDEQTSGRFERVTCKLGFWFTPDAQVDYLLRYSYADGRCRATLVDAETMAAVPIHRPGTCSAEVLARQQADRAGALSLRAPQRAR